MRSVTAAAVVYNSSHGHPDRDAAKHPTSATWHIRSLRCVTVRLGYSQNDGATISWSVERLLEGFDMSRRPLFFLSRRGSVSRLPRGASFQFALPAISNTAS